jgi:hypothetical protein
MEFEPGDWYPLLCQYDAEKSAASGSRISFPEWYSQRVQAARSADGCHA